MSKLPKMLNYKRKIAGCYDTQPIQTTTLYIHPEALVAKRLKKKRGKYLKTKEGAVISNAEQRRSGSKTVTVKGVAHHQVSGLPLVQ